MARVFSELKPRTPLPEIVVEFCSFANANSSVRLDGGRLRVRITDVLDGAPPQVIEALTHILLAKLFRRPVPKSYSERYRRYLNRKDLRSSVQQIRRTRGRKLVEGPSGAAYNLEEMFEDLNFRYFHGLMARPLLGWSRRASRTRLGHYDASHHAIVLSKLLDNADVPRMAVEYVLFHEMLHLRFPVEHRGARRCVHTPEFKRAEKQFEDWKRAEDMLKQL